MICVVGYKTRTLKHLVHSHGFDYIITCCDEFKEAVLYTQHRREPRDDIVTTCEGIYLAQRQVSFSNPAFGMVMRVGHQKEREIRFCPFCGAEIEVKETTRVRIVRTGGFRNRSYKEVVIKKGNLTLLD